MSLPDAPCPSRSAPVIGLLLAALALAGCGGDDDALPDDGGPGPEDAAQLDGGGPPDIEAPRVVSMTPEDGADGVPLATDVRIRFSEPMRAVATWSARSEGADVPDVDASLEGDTLTLRPAGGWPSDAEIEIRLGDDWADRAGNRLARPFVARFETLDRTPPVVVASTPAEGATDVSARTGAIRVRFSEPMDQAAGTLRIEGGPGELSGEPSWTRAEVTFGVRGLANGTAYRIVLEGFVGLDGLPLDGAPLLVDGAIDFTTRRDDEAPRVIAATPAEGQVDVDPARLGSSIEVRFDEPMRTSTARAPLVSGGATREVPITWVDATTARFDVSGALALDAETALDLRGLADAAGNTLDPVPYLGDGWLDFTTGRDLYVPRVVASSPEEGATNVPNPVREIRIGFSEEMDASIDEVDALDVASGTTTRVRGAWTAGGTSFVVPGTAIDPGRAWAIDLRGLRDLAGTPVSPSDPYTIDGRLDFSLATPTGGSCDEPLTRAQATESAPGVLRFEITAAARTRNNGSASCDPDGFAGGDAVIRVRKTTPAVGQPGGRALRIRTLNVSNRANIEVFRDVCDPRDPGAPVARVRCANQHDDWDIVLDVGPGDYYVWVSQAVSGGATNNFPVFVEEVEALPEGQSCGRPYDTTSALHTTPASGVHRWEIPARTDAASIDIADSNGPFEAISCQELVQDDVVFAFDKASDDTVLDVTVRTVSWVVTAEIVTGGCRPDATGATRGACLPSIGTTGRRFTVRAPAGPVHLWLASTRVADGVPAATVEIRELPAPSAPGSSCATAIPITTGTSVPVTPAHAGRYDAPSCFPVATDVTWYSVESTEALTHLRTDLAGAVALVRGDTGAVGSCRTDATTVPATLFAPPGTRVCVAVATGSGITALDLEQVAYQGAGPGGVVALPIARPSLAGTTHTSITGEDWMAVTPTRLYQNAGTYGVVEAALDGTTSVIRLDVDVRSMGQATAIGEQVFSVTQMTTTGPRIFRFVDPSARWSPVVWDEGTVSGTYRSANYQAIASDGTHVYTMYPAASAAATPSEVYRLSATAPGTPSLVGRVSSILTSSSSALASDGTYLYVSARLTGSANTHVYRIAIADLDPEGPPATAVAIGAVASAGQIAIDRPSAPRYLYARGSNGTIHVIGDPAGASPRYLGVIFEGETGDSAFGVDPATGRLFTFSTRWDAAGAWYRVDP